jgi:hypothetical protein
MPRKVILSRKGFDSTAGGKPSFIFGDRLLSLPIPGNGSGIRYNELRFDNHTPLDLVMKDVGILSYTDCHLDPDLIKGIYHDRHPEWKPAFGQALKSEKRLKKEKVGETTFFFFMGGLKKFNRPKESTNIFKILGTFISFMAT